MKREEEEADQGFGVRKEREGRRGNWRSEKGKEGGGMGGRKGKRERKGGESREEEWEEKDRRGGQKRWREEEDRRGMDISRKRAGGRIQRRHEQATFRRDQMFVGLYCFRNNTNININKISVSLLACGMHNIPWYKLAKKANTVGYNCTLEP
jgi:hypothetical protein